MSLVPYLQTLLTLTLKEFFFLYRLPFPMNYVCFRVQNLSISQIPDSGNEALFFSRHISFWDECWFGSLRWADALRAGGACLNLTCGWAVAVCLPHSSSLCFLDMLQCTLSNKVVLSSQFSLSCFRHMISATQHSPGIFAENATFSGYILTSRLRFHTICLYWTIILAILLQ